jgi:hypothetical protein
MNIDKSQNSIDYKSSNILIGVIAGILASLIGTILYALYPFLFGIQINLLAIGVGFIIGIAINKFAGGRSPMLGVVGAFLSLISCVVGDVLSAIAIYSYQNSVPFFEILSRLNLSSPTEILPQIIGIENILFYIPAILIGYLLPLAPPLPDTPKTKDEELKSKKIWRTRWILVGFILFFAFLCLTVNFLQQQ